MGDKSDSFAGERGPEVSHRTRTPGKTAGTAVPGSPEAGADGARERGPPATVVRPPLRPGASKRCRRSAEARAPARGPPDHREWLLNGPLGRAGGGENGRER
ncbi:hypothetical protein GCM10015536_10410 [Streptomyces griseomycini]|nr:hypothetical protein GCM10015536_10410 [Streptomyces griseomycini]